MLGYILAGVFPNPRNRLAIDARELFGDSLAGKFDARESIAVY